MGNLKSFDQFLTEAVQTSETTKFIADEIQASVGGLGTNERDL